ncbi:MAG: YdcF family protein [Blautia sp.]|nr:YdcF family protein [Blautia sp.]
MVKNIVWLVIGFVCLFYGVSLYLLHSGSRFYLFFFAMGIGFLALGWMSLRGYGKLLPLPVRAAGFLLAILILISVVIAEGCIFRYAREKAPEGLDAIIVLGAQVWPSGPSYSLRYRLDAARAYLEKNDRTICIVSGGQGINEPCTEAEAMAEYLTERGVSSSRVFLEDSSANTWENLEFSSKYCSPASQSIGIVTNDFHVFRALLLARRAGYQKVYGISAPSSKFYLPANALREYFALIKALFIHGIH